MAFTSLLGERDEPAALGAKAGNLGLALRQGLPVPPGFVIEGAAFAAVRGQLPADGADGASLRAAVASATWPPGLRGELAERFGALTKPCIVRSSAFGEDSGAASFAGQLDSIFPVSGQQELEDAVARCWASYFSDRCLAYQQAGRGQLDGMAVLVQQLVASAFSGVLFTRSPLANGHDAMLGEYCEGHGEALVAGRVDPGRFAVDRATLATELMAELDSAPPPAQLEELGRLGLRCEQLFGGPQDIEWTVDGDGRLFLVQSRPLTTAAPVRPAGRRVVWSNANVNENFPTVVSPLLYSVASTGYACYFRNLAFAFGVSAARRARLADAFAQIIGVHGGRIYYHLSHIHHILRGVPGGAFLSRSFDDFVGAEGDDEGEGPPPTRLWEWLAMALALLRSLGNLPWRVASFEARIGAFCAAWPLESLAKKSPTEQRTALRGFLTIRRDWNDAALADAAAMICYGLLGRILRRRFPDDPGLLHDLLKGLPHLVSGLPPRRLGEIAEQIRATPRARELFGSGSSAAILAALREDVSLAPIARAIATFQAEWGFRCSGELMLTQPGFDERPEALVELLRAYLRGESHSPDRLLAEQRASRLARTAELLAAMPWYARRPLAWLVRATQASIGLRERARLQQARLYHRLRHLALAIGRAWVSEGLLERVDDVFQFTIFELDEQLGGGALLAGQRAELARQRRLCQEELARAAPPPDQLVLAEGESWRPAAGRTSPAAPAATESTQRWQGVGAGSGHASGRPRVLREVGEAGQLNPGEILVTRQTDPGWAAIFPLIRGLVLERGGLLSHGAIIAREFGIPCVVGVSEATVNLGRFSLVQVDGDRGIVDAEL